MKRPVGSSDCVDFSGLKIVGNTCDDVTTHVDSVENNSRVVLMPKSQIRSLKPQNEKLVFMLCFCSLCEVTSEMCFVYLCVCVCVCGSLMQLVCVCVCVCVMGTAGWGNEYRGRGDGCEWSSCDRWANRCSPRPSERRYLWAGKDSQTQSAARRHRPAARWNITYVCTTSLNTAETVLGRRRRFGRLKSSELDSRAEAQSLRSPSATRMWTINTDDWFFFQMIDRADDIMTTRGHMRLRVEVLKISAECYEVISGFFILNSWLMVKNLFPEVTVTFDLWTPTISSSFRLHPKVYTLHFTCKRDGGARRKSLSRESPNSHFIWSKGPCASRYVWGINWSSVICDSSVLKTLALMQLPLTWCPAHNTSQFISNKLWMIWICRN